MLPLPMKLCIASTGHAWFTEYLPAVSVIFVTSAKIIQVNEWGCRDGMHHAKNCGNKVIPLAILSRILAQSCVTPLP